MRYYFLMNYDKHEIPNILEARGGRQLSYLRLSVTDLCNLRCRYCMPPDGVPKMLHSDILTYEEMLRLCRIFARLGGTKLRLTGGEPLVRPGLVYFIEQLTRLDLFENLRLTTNGILLKSMAGELRQAGLSGINISIDAIEAETYAIMTGLSGRQGKDNFNKAWEGFHTALELGFKVKVNCVPLKGLNDGELGKLAALSLKYPIEVRFIEHMPVGGNNCWDFATMMQASEVLKMLEKELPSLYPVEGDDPHSPAKLYKPQGAPGSIGLISPMSSHFCGACNRLRLTSDGRLKPCLLSPREIDLAGPMRQGATDEELQSFFFNAAAEKPACHNLTAESANFEQSRSMSRIGG